eukprot:767353-Hanusia_phi.AAC.2
MERTRNMRVAIANCELRPNHEDVDVAWRDEVEGQHETYHDAEGLCEHSERYSLGEGPAFEEPRLSPRVLTTPIFLM